VKLTPLIFIFLILLAPGMAAAAPGDKLTIIPAPVSMENISGTTVKIDRVNESIKYTPTTGASVYRSTNNTPSISAGAQMIQDGLENTVINNVNNVFAGVGGLQLGTVNSTQDGSEVLIFAVAAHTIDPTKDPAMMARIDTMREIYIYAILLFAGILALFLIYQSVCPDDSAKMLEDFTGTYGYVAASDMAKYFINTCGWLLLGPGLYFGAIKINNFLVDGQMLSVLDQVAFSSDSIGLYIVMGLLWFVSIMFFAVRLVTIIIGAHVWILYGLGFAFKKVRWAAILITTQQIVLIFSQFAIIWVCCVVISYMTSQEMAWYSVSFVYLGLFSTVVSMEFLFLTWLFLWKLLSPKTLTTAIKIARYV
jgi:hypothetical protein